MAALERVPVCIFTVLCQMFARHLRLRKFTHRYAANFCVLHTITLCAVHYIVKYADLPAYLCVFYNNPGSCSTHAQQVLCCRPSSTQTSTSIYRLRLSRTTGAKYATKQAKYVTKSAYYALYACTEHSIMCIRYVSPRILAYFAPLAHNDFVCGTLSLQ